MRTRIDSEIHVIRLVFFRIWISLAADEDRLLLR